MTDQTIPESLQVEAERIRENFPNSLTNTITLLRRWLPYAPERFRGSSLDGPVFKVLGALIGRRVLEILKVLESSQSVIDHNIAGRIRLYGSWKCPQAPGMGKAWAKSIYGWIGIEMGNPSWQPGQDAIYIALPTCNELEELAGRLGAVQGKNEYFKDGYLLLKGIPRMEKDTIFEIERKHNLKGWLMHGCNIIYSIKELS